LTYHVVFDISQRFPEAAIGVLAVVGGFAFIAMLLVPAWRPLLRRTSWFWLASVGLLWAGFGIYDTGIPYGLLFAAFAIPAFLVALLAFRDRDVPMRGGDRVSGRLAAFALLPIYLIFTAAAGCAQLGAFDLSRQLAAGDATVVTGTVQNFVPARQGWGGGAKGPECFTVTGHRYCYNIGVFSSETIGFHWIQDDGGPIRDGLQVRVSSVGDVIVRLEVADGQ
jgi:hypothetical protein